ncbi:signal peptidase II [Pigmentibacter ruber]|uniref:signal peptidase II n=1 Tax=Pigmentibacter ruber TaxID=2683196 RepID=UPI00131DAED3|nr:signal peptidase II [Pigmentibacter ruber]
MQKSNSNSEDKQLTSRQTIFSMCGYLFLFLGMVLLDQVTKLWSEKAYLIESSLTNIREYTQTSNAIFHLESGLNWLHFDTTYVRNTGAAWGFMGNLPENIRPYFFYVLTSAAMIVILIFFFKTKSKLILTRLGIALIFSGAAGNFIDRVWLHYVIDWIHFSWNLFGWNYDYPVFNVADCAVTLGVTILIIETIIDEIRNRKAKKLAKG